MRVVKCVFRTVVVKEWGSARAVCRGSLGDFVMAVACPALFLGTLFTSHYLHMLYMYSVPFLY